MFPSHDPCLKFKKKNGYEEMVKCIDNSFADPNPKKRKQWLVESAKHMNKRGMIPLAFQHVCGQEWSNLWETQPSNTFWRNRFRVLHWFNIINPHLKISSPKDMICDLLSWHREGATETFGEYFLHYVLTLCEEVHGVPVIDRTQDLLLAWKIIGSELRVTVDGLTYAYLLMKYTDINYKGAISKIVASYNHVAYNVIHFDIPAWKQIVNLETITSNNHPEYEDHFILISSRIPYLESTKRNHRGECILNYPERVNTKHVDRDWETRMK